MTWWIVFMDGGDKLMDYNPGCVSETFTTEHWALFYCFRKFTSYLDSVVGKLRKPQIAKQGTCRCELLKQFHYTVPDHSNLQCSFRRRWCTCKLEGYKNRLQNIHVRRRQIVSPRRRNERGFWHRRPTMTHKSLDFSAGHSQSSLLLSNRYNTSRKQLKT